MNKIQMILISVVVIGITIIFFSQYSRQTIPSTEEFPPVAKFELGKIFDISVQQRGKYMRDIMERYDPFLNEKSLINLVHIVKEGSDYEISCQFGSAYETVNLHRFFPEGLVTLGQIKNCDVETAKAIDQAITSNDIQCLVPLDSDMSGFRKNDYYLITLLLEQREITQELIDTYDKEGECAKPLLENFIGEITSTVFTAIVDLDENYIYF
ncbi:MAG: hypothetical protein IB617_00340 [Candidatus Nealsonbacteria bacterium]|nr:MAG: hypothetical protein IB617_00340 [Candidatus Nealsonbacteria bacterium]